MHHKSVIAPYLFVDNHISLMASLWSSRQLWDSFISVFFVLEEQKAENPPEDGTFYTQILDILVKKYIVHLSEDYKQISLY